MAILGIDYSWARPTGKLIHDAGYVFVCRYLSDDTTGKNITAAEAQDLLSNGLGIVLVWEQRADQALNGHAQGVADAQKALSQARAIGFPDDKPLYFAVDFDEADTDIQNNALKDYFTGVATVIPLGRIGIYSGYYPMKRMKEAGLVTWLWQTLAWSGGQIYDGIHIYQNGQSAFGSGADVDEAHQADIGAWGAGSSVTPTPEPIPEPTPEPAPPVVPSSGATYTVVSGDTLSGIGAKTNSDWRAIAQLNGIPAPYVIYPGEVLKLPGAAPAPAPPNSTVRYTVVSGDTLSGIGAKFGVSWQVIAATNGISDPNKIYPGQVLIIPNPVSGNTPVGGKTYTVVSGDTLSGIGAKTGTNWYTIASMNGISAPYTIYPGQVLKLP